MNKTRISVVAGLAALGFAGLASANPFGPASLTSGLLTFSDFEATINKCSTCTPDKVKQITVNAINGGIQFQANFSALDNSGKKAVEDVLINYEVTAPAAIIHDIFLGVGGISITGTGTNLSDVIITEAVYSNSGLTDLVGSASVSDPPPVLTDDVDLTGGPYETLWVQKDIGFTANCKPKDDCSALLGFSDIDQEFSTTSVPEPGMLALLAGSLLGFGLWMRRRARV